MTGGVIMVVDDNLASLKLLIDLLGAEGYQVRPADSGQLALASVAVKPPELILLDIRMPDMDGFEVLRRLKANAASRSIPVLFLSAAIEGEQRVEGFKLGAVDFISKPFQREELLARVGTHLELFRLRTQLERRAADLQSDNERLLRTELAERKHTEEVLARGNAELQRFAEISAHHLQEPAARIARYAERLSTQLAGRVEDAEALFSLNFIGDEARRQKNQLRDIQRYLAAGQPRGEVENIDVRVAVEKILNSLAGRIGEAGAEVALGDLPSARIDAPRLTDLFEVALDNAVLYGRSSRPPRIAVAGERVGERVHYSVSDNGPGIDEIYRNQVFRVFERLTTGGRGTGIGLSILRRVVESTGGHAAIEETPGGGCRLLFDLPAGDSP